MCHQSGMENSYDPIFVSISYNRRRVLPLPTTTTIFTSAFRSSFDDCNFNFKREIKDTWECSQSRKHRCEWREIWIANWWLKNDVNEWSEKKSPSKRAESYSRCRRCDEIMITNSTTSDEREKSFFAVKRQRRKRWKAKNWFRSDDDEKTKKLLRDDDDEKRQNS